MSKQEQRHQQQPTPNFNLQKGLTGLHLRRMNGWVSGMCLGIWKVSGTCFEGVWNVPKKCLEPIVSGNFFWAPHFFRTQNFSDQNFMGEKNIQTQNIFRAHIFIDPNFLWTQFFWSIQ